LGEFAAKYPAVDNVVGPWTGRLSHSGEVIRLVDSAGGTVDSVTYADSGDWAAREHSRGGSWVETLTRGRGMGSIVRAGAVAEGDQIQIFGADQAAYNQTSAVGASTVNTISYAVSGNPAESATGTIYARRITDHNHTGWSWVSYADGLGKSLELVNPALTNNE